MGSNVLTFVDDANQALAHVVLYNWNWVKIAPAYYKQNK